METISCTECGNGVSNKATACPHCGFPLKRKGIGCFLNSIRDLLFANPKESAKQALEPLDKEGGKAQVRAKKSHMINKGRSAEDRYEYAKGLIKQATALKRSGDLSLAVAKIEEAISISPEKDVSDYFKLADYLRAMGQQDRAFAVYRKLAAEQDPRDVLQFNVQLGMISEQCAKHLFREKRFSEYIWYECDGIWNWQVGLAAQGRFAENPEWKRTDWHPLTGRNSKKAFAEIERSEYLCEFERTLVRRFCKEHSEFHQLSEFAEQIKAHCHTSAEFAQDSQFMAFFLRLQAPAFSNFFTEELAPLLSG